MTQSEAKLPLIPPPEEDVNFDFKFNNDPKMQKLGIETQEVVKELKADSYGQQFIKHISSNVNAIARLTDEKKVVKLVDELEEATIQSVHQFFETERRSLQSPPPPTTTVSDEKEPGASEKEPGEDENGSEVSDEGASRLHSTISSIKKN